MLQVTCPSMGIWAGPSCPRRGYALSRSPAPFAGVGGAALRPQGSSGQSAPHFLVESGPGRVMAATRERTSAREIFNTLEYGPVPESHACALVRACRSALPIPLPRPPGPVWRATPVMHRGSSAAPPFSVPVTQAAPLGPTLEGRSLDPLRLLLLNP